MSSCTFSFRLTSERGLPALRTLFDNVRFKGKGHEVRAGESLTADRNLSRNIEPTRLVAFVCARFLQAEDLRLLMQKMENWAHRLYPKLQFEDFVDKVEKLGNKKEVQVGRRQHDLSFHSNDLLTITQFIIIRSHFMFPFVSCRPVSSVFDWTCRWPTKTSWGVREENVFLISIRPMSKSSTSYSLNSATWGGCILKTC